MRIFSNIGFIPINQRKEKVGKINGKNTDYGY